MIKYDKQTLRERIVGVQQSIPEVEAAALISIDGLIMASALPQDISEDRISAMSAAMLSLGQQINKEVGLGQLEQLYTRGSNGYVVLLAVGQQAVLTTLVNPEAKMGILFLKLRQAADELTLLLDGSNPT